MLCNIPKRFEGIGMNIVSIVNNKFESLTRASEYVVTELFKDEYYAETLIQICKHLEVRFEIANELIVSKSNKEPVEMPISLDLKDRLGTLRPGYIVKNLTKHNHSYEIRINGEYDKPRITFLNYSGGNNYLVLTFGFTKLQGKPETDLTDEAAKKTDLVFDELKTEEIYFWMGENKNGEKCI